MQPVMGAAPESSAPSLEKDAGALAVFLDRYRYIVVLALSALYALGAVLRARGRPFWYDEIITLIAARAPDAAAAWRAAQATDISPPLPHLLTHWSIHWFGENELTARLPAIIGFWIFCLCLFHFTRRRTNIYCGIAALLLPVATEALRHSVDARAYGPELAFCGLALVAWQAAADGRHRWLSLPALAAAIIGALYCHYYAILMYAPLAGGELLRAVRARRIDWGIWAALAAGVSPLILRFSIIHSRMHGFASNVWTPPSTGQLASFWEDGLTHFSMVFVILLALGGLATIVARRQPAPSPASTPGVPDHELLAGVLLLAAPAIALLLAALVTHAYSDRYGIFAMAGFAFLLPMLLAYWTRGRALPALLLAIACLEPLVMSTLESPAPNNPYQEEPLLHAALERGPVVIADGEMFLRLWYYAPERLKSHLLYLSARGPAVKYMGFATIDQALLPLRRWAPLNVIEYQRFSPPGGEFLAYQNTTRPGWVLFQALEEGATVQVLSGNMERELLRIHRRSP